MKPLSLEQSHELIEKRYNLLTARRRTIIKPVEDAVIDHLYGTFQAQIRPIMNAVTSLVSHLTDSATQTISLTEATGLLSEILRDELRATLTEAEFGVFTSAAALRRFTPTGLEGKPARRSSSSTST